MQVKILGQKVSRSSAVSKSNPSKYVSKYNEPMIESPTSSSFDRPFACSYRMTVRISALKNWQRKTNNLDNLSEVKAKKQQSMCAVIFRIIEKDKNVRLRARLYEESSRLWMKWNEQRVLLNVTLEQGTVGVDGVDDCFVAIWLKPIKLIEGS